MKARESDRDRERDIEGEIREVKYNGPSKKEPHYSSVCSRGAAGTNGV